MKGRSYDHTFKYAFLRPSSAEGRWGLLADRLIGRLHSHRGWLSAVDYR